MAVRDYVVTVLSRESKSVRVELRLSGQSLWVGLFPGFVEGMLFPEDWVEGDAPPNESVFEAWLEKRREEEDDDFDPRSEIVSVEVIEGGPEHAWPLETPLGLDDALADALIGPPVVLEVTVERAGMLAHLTVGARWDFYRPDLIDEAYEFRGGKDAIRAWKRPRKAPKPKAPALPPEPEMFALARVREQTDASVLVDFVTLGDLPALELVCWRRLLEQAYPLLGSVHADYVARHLSAVRLVSVDVADEATRRFYENKFPKDEAGRKKHKVPPLVALRPALASATYRIAAAADKAWLAQYSAYHARGDWFSPFGDPLAGRPKASSPSEVSEFNELLEMARMEGTSAHVDMLAEGLKGTSEVVKSSLKDAAELGALATPLGASLGPLIGSHDVTTACAALALAKRIPSDAVLPSVVLATWRLEEEVATLAVEALRAFSALPPWAEKRLQREPFLPLGMTAEDVHAVYLRHPYRSSRK